MTGGTPRRLCLKLHGSPIHGSYKVNMLSITARQNETASSPDINQIASRGEHSSVSRQWALQVDFLPQTDMSRYVLSCH